MSRSPSSIQSPNVAHEAEATVEAARAVFTDQFENPPDPVALHVAYQQAPIAIQADHTHYSDGYALFGALPYGIAVAVRPTEGPTRVALASEPARYAVPPDAQFRSEDPRAIRILKALMDTETLRDHPADIAVATSVPDVCIDAHAAALTQATHRALHAAYHGSPDVAPPVASGTAAIAEALGRPYSEGYLLALAPEAIRDGALAPFVLADTTTYETIPVPADLHDALQWGLFDPDAQPSHSNEQHHSWKQKATQALQALRTTSEFATLSSFSALEHRALDTALDQVGDRHRATVRHLVTENRRVQKHVMALRHGDGQMIGALLHMTHASLQNAWQGTTAAANFLVEQAERFTHDGLYGAGMTGRDGYVLSIGRAPAYAAHIRTVHERYEAAFHHAPTFVAL